MEWRAKNPSRYKAYMKAYFASEHGFRARADGVRRWQRTNPEKVRLHHAKWRKEHPVAARERGRRRYVNKTTNFRAIPSPAIVGRIALYGGKCWMCGKPATHMDHVKPLAKGGPHLPSNLRPACQSCNCSKAAAWPVDTTSILSRAKIRIPA